MAKKLSDAELVTGHIQALNPKNAEIFAFLRQAILGTDPQISEQIKWNSPAFYYNGEMKPFDPKEYKRDIVVVNLHRGNILLVFPTGAKIDDKAFGKNTPDGRKIVEIGNLEDAKAKQQMLQNALKDWIAKVDV